MQHPHHQRLCERSEAAQPHVPLKLRSVLLHCVRKDELLGHD